LKVTPLGGPAWRRKAVLPRGMMSDGNFWWLAFRNFQRSSRKFSRALIFRDSPP
jgi:hypothetical protein